MRFMFWNSSFEVTIPRLSVFMCFHTANCYINICFDMASCSLEFSSMRFLF